MLLTDWTFGFFVLFYNKWFDMTTTTLVMFGSKVLATCFLIFIALTKCKELIILSCLSSHYRSRLQLPALLCVIVILK